MRPFRIMKIPWDAEGTVVSRPNRFLMIADVVDENGNVLEAEKVHVHDPGRLEEIIFPGNAVRLTRARKEGRKTKWTLVSGKVKDDWVLVNSSYHRAISEKILSDPEMSPISGIVDIRPEVTVGSSRIDFVARDRSGNMHYIEVKGCSLSIDGRALFPDAPTTRGTRHVRELAQLIGPGSMSAVIFLVLAPRPEVFSPKRDTDPDFADVLERAHEEGVKIFPLDLRLEGEDLLLEGPIPFEFR